jgi:TorA maturation chaperone TorD
VDIFRKNRDKSLLSSSNRQEKTVAYGVTEIENALQTIYSVRVNVYAHLAKVFYGSFSWEDVEEEIQVLIDYIEVLGESGEALAPLACRYREVAKQVLPEDGDRLEFEYNRLFVGPARLIAPPYESVYRTQEHLVMGETILDVRRAYREIGLEARNAIREPEDHIAIELEYLTELQRRCLIGLEKHDSREVLRMFRLERFFVEEHLLTWVPEFCSRIKEGSIAEVFRALADVLSLLLRKDYEMLEGLEDLTNHSGEGMFQSTRHA